MADTPNTRPTAGVIPHLVCANAVAAIDFYKRAFGAEEMFVLQGPDGLLMNGCVNINGGPVMLVDEMPAHNVLGPKAIGGSPVTIHLIVDDVDAVTRRAIDAGATVIMPVEDQFWGDRYGVLQDPFGHLWSVATQIREVSRDELEKAMGQMSENA
jgi:PhnB protein